MVRGLYGQRQGDEGRTAFVTFGDRITENQIVEGDHVRVIRKMASSRRWEALTAYTDGLLKQGHSKTRVDSMVSRATAGLRF